jgi:hypothetical protein
MSNSNDAIKLSPQPLQNIIPSYPFQEFSDDENIVAFFTAYNQLAQGYLNYANETPLSVYTSPAISGPLLDWIMNGIYGIERPVFSSLMRNFVGGLAVFPLGTISLGEGKLYQSGTATPATDDYYKRVGTWTLYLGDGRYFNTTNLRKKVARFLYGVSGTDITLAQTQTVSIASEILPPPPPPVLSSIGGGSFGARTYGVWESYVNSIGETVVGPPASLTVAAGNLLVVGSAPPENGALDFNVYVNLLSTNPLFFHGALGTVTLGTTPLGGNNHSPVTPATKQNATPIPIGTNWTEPATGLIVGSALPTANTSNTLGGYIITVPKAAGAAASYFQQAMQQSILPTPFMFTFTVVLA